MDRCDAKAVAGWRSHEAWRYWSVVASALAIAGCGGGGGGGSSSPPGPQPPAATYSVSGTVSGLTNPAVLEVSSATDLTVSANGPVTFLSGVASGTSYAVSVRTQPANPRQECTVTNGAGTVSGNVSNIAIQCVDVPLTLSSSTPMHAATAASRDDLVLTFSAPLNPNVPATAVTLEGAGGAVAASLNVNGNQLIVTPAQRLLPVMVYTLTASTAIQGASGELLAAPVVVNFTTADGAWGQPRMLGSFGADPRGPRVAFDSSGNAIAIWQDTDTGRDTAKVQRYLAGSGWEQFTGQVGVTAPGGVIYNQQLAFDASGNAMALWFEDESVRTNRYVGGVWTGGGANGQVIQAGNAHRPQLAVDPNGNAYAVWAEWEGTRHSIRARRYTTSGGWGTAHLLETQNNAARFPQIGADAAGNMIVVWEQTDGTRDNIWTNRYVAGTGWSGAALIESDNSNAFEPMLAVHPSGDAIAVWQQTDGAGDNLWANRYVAGSGWTGATLLETGDDSVHSPKIAFGANGDAIVVWEQGHSGRLSVLANHYVGGSGWSGPTLLETDNQQTASFPQIVVDPRGNAIALWAQLDGLIYSFWANRYVVGRGWGSAMPLETGAGHLGDRHIAIDSRGNAFAVWIQYDGERNRVWVNRFE